MRSVAAVPPRGPARPSNGARAGQGIDIDIEAALVEAARKVLHEDPARTLELAAQHARQFPSGVLALEREALAIHALALLGRQPEARARLSAFEAAHPRSIHVTRLQHVLSDNPVGPRHPLP